MLQNLSRHLNKMRGFTMIELLVVIAIIGVLAVAVLSAINPIEQINKGRDTRTRSDAAELLSATERFFSTQEQYPWNTATGAQAPFTAWDPATMGTDLETDPMHTNRVDGFAWLQALQVSNEVKPAFAQRLFNEYNGTAATPEFIVLKEDTSDEVRVCFLPTSQQFRLEASRKCCAIGSAAAACNEPAALALRGSTPATLDGGGGAFTLCDDTDGDVQTVANDFWICLP